MKKHAKDDLMEMFKNFMKFEFENFDFEQRLIKFVELNSLFYKENSPALEDYLEIFVTIKKHAFDYDDFYRFIPEFGGNLFHYENKKIKCEEDMLGALKWVIQTAYEDKPILDNIVRDIKLAQKGEFNKLKPLYWCETISRINLFDFLDKKTDYSDNEIKEFISFYEKKKDVDALCFIAYCYDYGNKFYKQDKEKAIEYYKMCINENFRFITFNRYIGEIYTELEGDTQKNYYKAIKHFKSAFLYGDEHSCYKLVDCFLALNKKNEYYYFVESFIENKYKKFLDICPLKELKNNYMLIEFTYRLGKYFKEGTDFFKSKPKVSYKYFLFTKQIINNFKLNNVKYNEDIETKTNQELELFKQNIEKYNLNNNNQELFIGEINIVKNDNVLYDKGILLDRLMVQDGLCKLCFRFEDDVANIKLQRINNFGEIDENLVPIFFFNENECMLYNSIEERITKIEKLWTKNNTNNLNCVVTKIDFDYAQDIKESIIKFYHFDELILLLSAQNFECNINNIKIITKEEYNKERSKEKLKSNIDSGYISTSMIQRHLFVGYPKACEIMDELREKQFVSTNREEMSKNI